MAVDTCAIIVGVDGYAFAPLSSAVNDAVALFDELTGPGPGGSPPLVAAANVTLLVSPTPGQPTPPGSSPATRRAILDALKPHYESSAARDRLFFYFAGHGMSASRDGRVRESLILPVDVQSSADGQHMICLDDLLGLFAERGPLEQLWLIDACRDMPYERRPRGYDIDWLEELPQGPRAQFAIHAVATGGKALSQQGGHGRFTDLLLRGLRGTGSANEYVPGRGHCVTAPSLFAYVHRHMNESLQGWDDWTRTVQVPEPRQRGPALRPLRDVPPPQPRAFAVSVVPPRAAQVIDVTLEVQQGLPVPSWPPTAPARLYELRAALKSGMAAQGWGQPIPHLRAVDLREEDGATVEVPRSDGSSGELDELTVTLPPSAPKPPTVTTGERGITRATVARSASAHTPPRRRRRSLRRSGGAGARSATLRVSAHDLEAHVQLRMAQHPFTVIEHAPPNQDLTVAPGAWDVQVMLGDEVISAARLLLAAGERGEVTAVAQITPALATLLPPNPSGADDGPPTSVTPSESIGPMQGAVLPTLLPLLALKRFDFEGGLLRQFTHLDIPRHGGGPATGVDAPQRTVVVAFDGETRPGRYADVQSAARVWASSDQRLLLYEVDGEPRDGCIDVFVPGARMSIAAPALPGAVTVVSAIAWPSGATRVSVGIYRLPLGLAWPQPGSDGDTYSPPGRSSRALAIAAPWFRAGADLDFVGVGRLREVVYGNWLDPVLGLIAFHALHERRHAARRADAALDKLRAKVQQKMLAAFGALSDCRIIAAVRDDPDAQRAALTPLLDDPTLGQPVLTASLAVLAEAARRAGRDDHWSIDRLDRIAPGEVFNAVVNAV